jgi:hypothetical protein
MEESNTMNIQNIVHAFRPGLENIQKINTFEKKVLDDISLCRTPALGGHIMACKECGAIKATYNSCNNRHCPGCGSYKRDKWVAIRKTEALPVQYFHVVFTVPAEFNILFLMNPKGMYSILFKAAWTTIESFAKDHKYLGAKAGMLAVLHTWGQNIGLHPHLHCLIPGGGIDQNNKWRQMKKANGKFLFPVKALSVVFKARFCAMVGKQFKLKTLKPPHGVTDHYKWMNSLHNKKWVVYAKKPLLKGASVVEYLGRYTHKVAISNSRIKAIDNENVTFSWLDYRTSKVQDMQLTGEEFLRRLLLHILPHGFPKVRYYGFMANRNKTKAIAGILRNLRALPEKSLKGLP